MKIRWIMGLVLGLVLLGVGAWAWLQQDDSPTSADSATPAPVTNLRFITTSVNVTTQETRYVITVWQGTEYYDEVASVQVQAFDPNQAGHPLAWEGEAVNYSDYAIPYWVVYPQFSAPGRWRLDITATTNDGATAQGTLFAIVDAPDESITVGMPAPASQTLTNADGPLHRISSDTTPNAAFYEQTVAEAVSSGRPSLIVFATPGLCSSFICAPMLDSSIQPLWETYQDDLNVVHVEVYNLQTSEYVAAMAEWGLNYEPWTYLIDADGQVVARYDGPLAPSEIQDQIEAMLATSS